MKESKLDLKSQENRLLKENKYLIVRTILWKNENTHEDKEGRLSEKQQLIDEREKVENLIDGQQKELERIAALSRMKQRVDHEINREELNHELTIMVKESEQRAKEEADRKAKISCP